ncbi:membrane protein [Clostridium acetobutylicum]|nr:membrane protein [Clostridium acetobutylicum]
MSELTTGISTIGMGSTRKNINIVLDSISSAKKNLNSALQKLESDSNSSRVRTKIDELGREFKSINQLGTKIERIGKNIDYAINKFEEVDRKCSERLKASSYDYRKSIGLLTNTEKYGGVVGSCVDWGQTAWKNTKEEVNNDITYISNLPPFQKAIKVWNKYHIGAYLYTGVEIVVGVLTIAASVATIVGEIAGSIPSGGVSLLAIGGSLVALVHGVNSVYNGVQDLKSIGKGDFDKVGNNKNYLQEGYEYLGGGTGWLVGKGIDGFTNNKNNQYASELCGYGKTVGYVGYYGADMYFGRGSVKDSLKILKAGDTVKNLWTTYEVGNWVEGSKIMRDLKIVEKGPSLIQKGYAAINGSSNGASIVYDAKSAKGDSQFNNVTKDIKDVWDTARNVLSGTN